jgi:hypothetical protein
VNVPLLIECQEPSKLPLCGENLVKISGVLPYGSHERANFADFGGQRGFWAPEEIFAARGDPVPAGVSAAIVNLLICRSLLAWFAFKLNVIKHLTASVGLRISPVRVASQRAATQGRAAPRAALLFDIVDIWKGCAGGVFVLLRGHGIHVRLGFRPWAIVCAS